MAVLLSSLGKMTGYASRYDTVRSSMSSGRPHVGLKISDARWLAVLTQIKTRFRRNSQQGARKSYECRVHINNVDLGSTDSGIAAGDRKLISVSSALARSLALLHDRGGCTRLTSGPTSDSRRRQKHRPTRMMNRRRSKASKATIFEAADDHDCDHFHPNRPFPFHLLVEP